MSKRALSFPLSRMNRGIDRYDPKKDQCEDALDVYVRDRDVQRRPAFTAIATGAPFILPSAKTLVSYTASGGSPSYKYDRAFSIAANTIGGGTSIGTIEVLCDEPFDGVDWSAVTADLTSVTGHSFLAPLYWDGTEWEPMPSWIDTTMKRFTNGSNIWFQTMCRPGRISWHRSQLVGWTAISVGGIVGYPVRFNVFLKTLGAADGYGALTGAGNIVVGPPGLLAFKLEPVRSIFPVNILGSPSVLACSDRRKIYADENGEKPRGHVGAAIGIIRGEKRTTEIAHLIVDEGAGLLNQATFPTWYQGAAAAAWRSGYTNQGGGPFTEGTAGKLQKNRTDYSWRTDQFRGTAIVRDLTGASGISNSNVTRRGGFTFTAPASGAPLVNAWEGFRLRCVLNPLGGTPVGEEREIFANTATLISYAEHFSAAPNAVNVFEVVRPHHRLFLQGSAFVDKMPMEISSVTAASIAPVSGRDFAPAVPSPATYCHWRIAQELQWVVRSGDFWSGCFDTGSKKFLMTNGENPLFEYDGTRFRELPATFDAANPRVQSWTGVLQDLARKNATDPVAGSEVEVFPARGKFVVDYNNRIVVCGQPGHPYDVQWSAPGVYNDIWPKVYRAQVRDAENNPITGMASLGDKLCVFTPTSIHTADPADDQGMLFFRPAAQGVGFVSHHAVAKVATDVGSALIGPCSEGVGLFAGAGVLPVLPQWDRVIKDGVNDRMLWAAVGAVSFQENAYFLAVPSSGSMMNDLLLRYQFNERAWWLWSAPWGGISSIVRDTDDTGRERMLFGTNDGYIAVLVQADTDDGDLITGRARGPQFQPGEGTSLSFTGVVVTALETGAVDTLTIKSYLDARDSERQAFVSPFDAGSSIYNAASYEAAGPVVQGQYTERTFKTRKVNLPIGSIGEGFQLEISGSRRWAFKAAELLAKPKSTRSK